MTQKDVQKIAELLKPELQNVIEKTVNGKIENIRKILETQNTDFDGFKNTVESHITKDNEWKEEFNPYIKGLTNMTGGAKIVVWLAVGIGSVIATIVAIKKFFI